MADCAIFVCRWSQGLLFHQALVDLARSAILLPLGQLISARLSPVTSFYLSVSLLMFKHHVAIGYLPSFRSADCKSSCTFAIFYGLPHCIVPMRHRVVISLPSLLDQLTTVPCPCGHALATCHWLPNDHQPSSSLQIICSQQLLTICHLSPFRSADWGTTWS
jgi:hypothetical protein